MEIQQQRSTLIVLVQFNQIPLSKFINPENLRSFNARYKFASIEPVQDPATGNFPAINLITGLYNTKEAYEIAISRLGVEERKIVIHMDGPSEHAHNFFNELRTFLAGLAGVDDKDYLSPIILTEESEIISQLNFPIQKLIAPKLQDFAFNSIVEMANLEVADASIGSISVEFKIDYLPKDNLLNERRITLARKDLVLQLAVGHRIEEQIYASKAPFDTNTHIQILAELEKTINK